MTLIERREMPWVIDVKSAQDFLNWAARRMWPNFDPFSSAAQLAARGNQFEFVAALVYDDLRDVAEAFMVDAGIFLLDWVQQS